MHLAASIIIIIALSFQVFPVALGFSAKGALKNIVLPVLILSLTQTVFFLLGHYAGEQFMHLLNNFKFTILFAGFFLIGIRMIMEILRIRKGERTFLVDDNYSLIFAAMAQSMNTFLAALLLFFIPVDKLLLALALLVASVIFSLAGIMAKPERLSFLFASLLYLIGGILIIVSSLYFIFAAF